ncbi:zinc finger protein swm isoform X3 [Anoplophora glabripennis]|uniref:zinc finger protein swm isoform X3 n=1 Tax=Anoplophora glabripennis TaxID=217634 RepID=UPI0008754DB8|nr:zinc finger protein swm isoform X3 [Anoplophora glabripennis]
MIIEQVDAFKSWLTAVLRPMCEADPAALAKYVLALIKKDKSEEELRKSMVGQLDVFLEGETESFVDLVFQTLNTKDYINTPVIPNANPPNPNVVKSTKEQPKESKMIVQPSELPNLNEAINGAAKKEAEARRDRELRKNSDAEREDRPLRRRSPRHRSLSRNRSKSRSRSWDRLKRSRSREKSREREQHRLDREKRERNRPWRNKSPLRRYERRRSRASRTPSPIRPRSRSRSPRHSHRGRYRTRATASRSRSRSLEKRDRRDSLKEKEKEPSRPGTPTQDSNHGDMDLRLTNSTQSIQSVVVQQGSKKRCRDFDEKGYCMRGEMCPFDHGIDPVVLEDATLTRVLSYNPNGTPVVVPSGVIPTPVLNAPGHPMLGQRHPVPQDNPYNPQAPQIWRDARFRGPRPLGIPRVPPLGAFPQQPNMNRELIPVPVMDQKQPEGYTPIYNQPPNFMNNMDHENMYKKKAFDFNRLGPRSKNLQNCSLELKKVPQGVNSITHLNNHFSKFGKIVNIQVQFEGDPEAAIITFSTHAEANAAYRSTEAVLNNRFIKVFWHSPNAGAEVQPRADASNGTAAADAQELDPEAAKAVAKENKEETKAQATAAIKKNQELLAAQAKVNKNKDVQRKEVLKIQNDLRKRKQELLEKQLSQQKVLIEKMEKLPAGPQRDIIKDTIKKTQEAIEDIKKDIEAATLLAKSVPQKKTKEEAQRELLDTELDLITKQQEGADTSEIQKKLLELRAKVASVRGRGRGARRYTPRHLLTKNNLVDNTKLKGVTKPLNRTPSMTALSTVPPFQKHTVDHRPTRLLVSGYETDEQDSVLNHFQQYGEIVDYVVDASLPSLTLNYKTRKEAEMALLKGKNFQDRTLSITWSNKQLSRQRSGGSSTRTVLMSETEEDQLIDQSLLEGDEELGPEISEEALLQDDEEEEDEDRSWRR